MAYKTILVHVDETRRAAERLKLAAALALAGNGHLTGMAFTGVSRFLSDPARAGDPGLASHLALLRRKAKSALEFFERSARMADVTSYDSCVIDDEAGAGMALHARCSDLLVIGQTDLDEPSPSVTPDFPEFVVINSGRPVLAVPNAGRFDIVGNRVLVAWDGSLEASRAVTAALPILQRAALVRVGVFNASASARAKSDQPGADIVPFLARHGVDADVVYDRTRSDIGHALLDFARSMSADLMVMGAYGHSRFREIMLGGVTRTVLDEMTLPVLMAH